MVNTGCGVYSVPMASISGISKHRQHASILAATKTAVASVRYIQAAQEDRDRVAKTITPVVPPGKTRENLTLTDTYEADDTFAHTEAMKLRGGRLDLII